MLTARGATMYGWVTVGILLVLLWLVWTGAIDSVYRLPILVFAILLVVSRVILRLIIRRRTNAEGRDEDPE